MPAMTIYWISFALLIVLAFFTLQKLFSCAKKTPPIFAESVESFLLWACPRFPALAFAKILPGTFVGFGILGTFLGFANGISKIDMQGSAEEVFLAISSLLSGLNSAFVTSIIGVILSIFFSISFQLPLHKIKSILKKSSQEKEKDEDESVIFSMKEYSDQIQSLTERLVSAKDSMESLPQKFDEVGKSLENSINPVKETFFQMQNTLQNYAEQAKSMEAAAKEIGGTLKNFLDANEKSVQSIFGIFEKSDAVSKSIIEENKILIESHKTTLEEYRLLDENISEALETLNKNVAQYSATMEKTLVETLEKFVEAAKEASASILGE